MSVALRRAATLGFSATLSALACFLFIRFIAYDGNDLLDFPRTLMIAVSTFWLAYGVSSACIGVLARTPAPPPHVLRPASADARRVAIVVPVYNEDPPSTFSRIAAMDSSLERIGAGPEFHFAVLSDTTSSEVAQQEAAWFERLVGDRAAEGRMFYRRRPVNTGKKAGNIEDFISRSGGAYDYVLILDADSLMEGETILEMVRRMDADPKLGLLQTLPTIIHAQSFFGRAMQFSASYYSPIYARGLAWLQGREGPFWGHNAMVRTAAFAASCGLPVLSGKPPFGGHILSHDYVEAALLARNGWTVRLDTDLGGSYEEGPENLIEFAKRDRRWCQGNLQHTRIIPAPGLRFWNRFTFLQGIFAYVASPIWLVFLATSLVAAALAPSPLFASPRSLPPVHREYASSAGLVLLISILALLVLPKVLILIRGIFTGDNRRFGGNGRVAAGIVTEILFTSLIAPIMLMLQSRAVFQVIFGLDGGWPATRRSEGRLSLRDAWAASHWIVLGGGAALAAGVAFTPEVAVWLLPVTLPMIAAPVIVAFSSRSAMLTPHFLFSTPSEVEPSPVIVERARILDSWTGNATAFGPHHPDLAEELLINADA